ncbi:nickel/cobalt efflux protein RcnA [Pseudomonas syringae group genomosp. 3]|uniref:nickel/cobalt efflux protein RcnA n=1 Tax=Pseudomonas syringae group genomosp. 3 TaxID=251701 RepID=UPI0006E546C0|nr:nickel/cobalt efflux protein RcnA [Pseudomonas syringae group genomosp. 3]KPW51787.1 Nickel/cobalt efflux protein RcnA [Pseudomonas syringae pv. berberidis]KPY13372.1 Nickel/cobalt efflux protein RcnA [Pseudomonas syringae pv. philadelphi]RMM26547.1 Nickel/cobalt efflux protein RcnA [Pseudomonas syringae pv. berberidis]RMP70363.1 Nickel/cobalt efflux protein RcnA [Pseudomonas syringae pv. berberidis]RMQ39490.1 Nickel/cobalt efflux protein RcnA [Pseudomonas syringae pv. berberidis]
MPDFASLLQQGGSHAWLFFPSAILLGALHGLEPGHSKTMMAAFIVAIRGSVKQAVMLGLAATLSHTAVVWLIAIGGMYLGQGLDAETTEPYFQLASSALIIPIALWMLWRTWRGEQLFKFEEENSAHHGHDETHHHSHGHSHDHSNSGGLALTAGGYQDAHEKAHADDIRKRFTNREVSNGQILMFGLTGGLIPCPAAITVLLLCLQVKQVTLGAAMVLCFSIGLAITLVTVGAAAAIGARKASNRFPWLNAAARRAPYLSSVLIICVGIYVGIHGWNGLYS